RRGREAVRRRPGLRGPPPEGGAQPLVADGLADRDLGRRERSADDRGARLPWSAARAGEREAGACQPARGGGGSAGGEERAGSGRPLLDEAAVAVSVGVAADGRDRRA